MGRASYGWVRAPRGPIPKAVQEAKLKLALERLSASVLLRRRRGGLIQTHQDNMASAC